MVSPVASQQGGPKFGDDGWIDGSVSDGSLEVVRLFRYSSLDSKSLVCGITIF